MDPLQFLSCHHKSLDLDVPDMFLSSYRHFVSKKSGDIFLSLQERRKSGEKFLPEYSMAKDLLAVFYDDHIILFHPSLRSVLDAIVVDDSYDPLDEKISYTDYHLSRKEFIHRAGILSVVEDGKLRIPPFWRRIGYQTKDVHIQNFGSFMEVRDGVSFEKYIASINPEDMAHIYEKLA